MRVYDRFSDELLSRRFLKVWETPTKNNSQLREIERLFCLSVVEGWSLQSVAVEPSSSSSDSNCKMRQTGHKCCWLKHPLSKILEASPLVKFHRPSLIFLSGFWQTLTIGRQKSFNEAGRVPYEKNEPARHTLYYSEWDGLFTIASCYVCASMLVVCANVWAMSCELLAVGWVQTLQIPSWPDCKSENFSSLSLGDDGDEQLLHSHEHSHIVNPDGHASKSPFKIQKIFSSASLWDWKMIQFPVPGQV